MTSSESDELDRVLFTAIEAMPLGVIVANTDGKILYINKTFSAVSGHGPEVIGRIPRFLKSGHQPEDFYRRLWATITAGQIWNAEVINRRKDGTEYPARHIIVPIKDATGEITHFVGFQEDLTETKRKAVERVAIQETLTRERERAHVTLNSIADAVICSDIAGNITYLNMVAERLTGWPREEAAGRPMSEVLHIVDEASQEAVDPMALAPMRNSADHASKSVLIRRDDGFQIPIENSAALIRDHEGHVAGSVIVFRDVTAARAMALQMSHSASHDTLTGLPNRALLNERIAFAIALASRHKKRLAVLFLDLDGFKHVNDSLGHTTGDRLLKAIGQRLVDCVRGTDTVCRLGGDEFVVLLSEIERAEDPAITATRILEAVAEPYAIDPHDIHVTTSLGISVYPDDGLDAESLVRNADTAMYQAKAMGRRTHRFFEPAMNARAVKRQFIEAGLRRALERQELMLHYQPKVDLNTGSIIGAEALIRWNHPTQGLISPAQFIPIAEDCGLIQPIGDWVLDEACRQAQLWVKMQLSPGTMAVNVSAMQFQDETFLKRLLAIFGEGKFDPGKLEIEVTETVLMTHAEAAVPILQCLRGKGVRIALDDFGTGYSSLSYLQKFPVDTLKIDQSFVRKIGALPDGAALVTAVINIARSLNLQAVAEGVETKEELAFLKAQGCNAAQGYHFSRPVPQNELAKLLDSQKKAGPLFA
ncbi:MAG TPA: EAL domain-containing protein [Thermohalobaculum sp.]|nr:EAL domain-containing protein [Thermohalobaculum sp.]